MMGITWRDKKPIMIIVCGLAVLFVAIGYFFFKIPFWVAIVIVAIAFILNGYARR